MKNYDGNTKSHHKQMALHQHKETILKAYREVSHIIWWLIKKKQVKEGVRPGIQIQWDYSVWSMDRKEEKKHKDQWDSIECATTYIVLVPYAKGDTKNI